MIKKLGVKIWLSIAALGVLAVVCSLVATDSGTIEITKQEALQMMDLQTKAVMAVADRDEYLSALAMKYGVSLQTHSFNLIEGRFEPARSNNGTTTTREIDTTN